MVATSALASLQRNEKYQTRQQEAPAGMKGLFNIADRVLKYGYGITQEDAKKDHDENLRNFLLRQVELELNPYK